MGCPALFPKCEYQEFALLNYIQLLIIEELNEQTNILVIFCSCFSFDNDGPDMGRRKVQSH
jgi:hypothetical protein